MSLFEKRIEKLIKDCDGVQSAAVMQLLRRAEANHNIDLEQELTALRKKKSGAEDTQ
ncbi:MAG: hypothetical protein GY868_10875 [Deltaproteobacteria bacterium]|nr:hypothetical protein [Deltaproteobacteria bacterium]